VLIASPPDARAGEAPNPEFAAGVEPWAPLAVLYADSRAIRLPEASGVSFASARQEPAPPEAAAPKQSTSKAPLLKSLILPGWGELSMGAKGRATGFFIAEGLIWASYAYWTVAGNMREDDYIEQAGISAGVGVTSESDDYWRLVGQYKSSSGGDPGTYEEELRREARDLYPTDPAAQDAYVAERLPTGDRAWSWSTPQAQALYDDTREDANTAFNNAEYSFAAAILNRVLSVIDVQLLRHKASKEAREGALSPSYRVLAAVERDGGGRLILQRRF
jgi:hypothetical protein